MRGDCDGVSVLRPTNAVEAIRLFGLSPLAMPIAGGTDLMVAWNAGEWRAQTVLDLSALGEWRKIEETADGLRVGALATHTMIRRDKRVRLAFPLLAQACATVGGVQIQNRGTLGGNIVNASPAGDTFPALAVYDATVHVVSAAGSRTLPFAEVFLGPKKTALAPGELVEAVVLPRAARPPSRQIFRKVGTRAAQAISKTVACGLLWFTTDGTVEELRFAFGSVAPTVRRARAVEKLVKGRWLTRGVVRDACQKLRDDIAPIDDVRSTAEYRMQVSQALLSAFLGHEPR